jgi:uncharacterized membrane protein required for colicin V production
MTTVQNMMLAVCFGAVMGFLIADVVLLVWNAIDNRKEKKRKREEKESADKAA